MKGSQTIKIFVDISYLEASDIVGSCESALMGLQYNVQVGCSEKPLNIWSPQIFPASSPAPHHHPPSHVPAALRRLLLLSVAGLLTAPRFCERAVLILSLERLPFGRSLSSHTPAPSHPHGVFALKPSWSSPGGASPCLICVQEHLEMPLATVSLVARQASGPVGSGSDARMDTVDPEFWLQLSQPVQPWSGYQHPKFLPFSHSRCLLYRKP